MGVKTLKKAVGSWRNYAVLGFHSASKEKVGNGLGMDFSISGVGARAVLESTYRTWVCRYSTVPVPALTDLRSELEHPLDFEWIGAWAISRMGKHGGTLPCLLPIRGILFF